MKRNVLLTIALALALSGCATGAGRSIADGVVGGVLDHFIGPAGSGIIVAALQNATRPNRIQIYVKPTTAQGDAGEQVVQAKSGI